MNRILLLFGILIFLLSCGSVSNLESDSRTVIEEDKTTTFKDTSDYELIKLIPFKGKSMATDKLQNIYLVGNDDELSKYSKEGKELYTYSNFDLGTITHLDATNPFSILVYYGDFQTAVILDRTLQPIYTFDLFEAQSPRIKAIGMSDDQNVWIYDEDNYRLKKINTQGEIAFESPDLSLSINNKYSPDFIIEANGEVLLSQENGEVFIFDNFSRFIGSEKFNIPNARLQVLDGHYIFLQKDGIHTVNSFLGKASESVIAMPIPPQRIISAEIQQQYLFLLSEKGLGIYRSKQ